MVVVPLARPSNESEPAPPRATVAGVPWARIAAAGTLIASGGLLMGGKHKAGLLAAAAGASLAMLDQKETVLDWWNSLPGYIGNVQNVLGQVQETLHAVSVQRDKLAKALHR